MGFEKGLVKYRKLNNYSQEALAEKCNVTRQAVAKWEKGESLPDVYTIAKLAKIFDISIEDLIWAVDDAVVEGRRYYVRPISEKDREDFGTLMKEHRFLGGLLRNVEGNVSKDKMDIVWNTYYVEGNTFVVCKSNEDSMSGYFYLEMLDKNNVQMSMQFKKKISIIDIDSDLLRDFYNWIYQEYEIKAIQVYLNSELERKLHENLGYKNLQEEVIISLPVK